MVTPLDFVYYPFSHSLMAAAAWALVFGGAYMGLRKAGVRTGAVLAVVVVSHWVLDALTHRPDMPLTVAAGSSRVGLGLWNSLAGTMAVELLLFARRPVALHAGHAGARPHRAPGALGPGGVPPGHLHREPVRPSSAERDGGRLERARHVAAGGVGLLGGPASFACASLGAGCSEGSHRLSPRSPPSLRRSRLSRTPHHPPPGRPRSRSSAPARARFRSM